MVFDLDLSRSAARRYLGAKILIYECCDLPRDFHPALIRAAAVVVMPFGALFAMGSGMPDPIAKIVSA